MGKKKKEQKNSFLNDMPAELRFMCLAELRGTGHYVTESILRYLADHMNDSSSFLFGMTHEKIIHLIDTACEIALFPTEFHEADWNSNLTLIRKVLTREEELLQKVAPEDCQNGYRTPYDYHFKFNFIAYMQRLNVYFCLLFMFTGEWEKLLDRLNKLLDDSKRNVCEMLSYKEAEEYASIDDWAEFHYCGVDMDGWQPIHWIYKEHIPNIIAGKMFAQVYEKYALSLYEMLERQQEGSTGFKACFHLCRTAENNLQHLCNRVLYGVNDMLEDASGNEQGLIEDKAKYEEMFNRSEERYKKICCEDMFYSDPGDFYDDSNLPF